MKKTKTPAPVALEDISLKEVKSILKEMDKQLAKTRKQAASCKTCKSCK